MSAPDKKIYDGTSTHVGKILEDNPKRVPTAATRSEKGHAWRDTEYDLHGCTLHNSPSHVSIEHKLRSAHCRIILSVIEARLHDTLNITLKASET